METLKQLVARVLDVDINSLSDDSSPNEIETWDSFNGLVMVSELESNFKVKFTMDEVMGVTKLSDIKKALKKHGVEIGINE